MPSKLVVKSHEPLRLRAAIAALAILVLVAAWGLFEWGQKAAGYNRVEAARIRGSLNDQISVLESENETLRRDLALLRTSDRVDQEAHQQVSVDLDDLQSQIAELNDELAFYRGIMSPADGQAGLQIKALQISSGANPDEFALKLILVQAGRHDGRVQGSVDLAVAGEMVSEENEGLPTPMTIKLSQLTGEPEKLRYSFRYFQVLERNLSLPPGFEPKMVEVSLSAKRKEDAVSTSFPWQVTDSYGRRRIVEE
ncbi:MAG: DUF6776 family protein [Gammaproteobacteria bacterium]